MHRLYLILGMALLFDSASIATADEPEPYTHEIPVGGAKPESKKWTEVVGKKVVVEGIAWGSLEKGFGEYVLLDGPRVYVENASFIEKKTYGRTVRVTGTLTLEVIPAAEPFSQGSSNETRIYKLRQATCEQIETVEWPWMKQVALK